MERFCCILMVRVTGFADGLDVIEDKGDSALLHGILPKELEKGLSLAKLGSLA